MLKETPRLYLRAFTPLGIAPVFLILAVFMASMGCTEEITGPKPAVEDPSTSLDPLPVAPGIVCRDQRVSDVVITGAGFSPVPIDVPGNPRTALPTVTLTRNQGLDGAASDGLAVVYNGDPDKPENSTLLSWQSQTQMTLNVVPPCADDSGCGEGFVCHASGVCARSADDTVSGAIEEGIYDVKVQNPNSNQDDSFGALAVIEKPTLATLTPPITCLAQGPRDITLSGTRFLTINEREANVSVDGVDAAFEINDGTFATCTAIPHAGYTTLQQCGEAMITLPQDSVAVGYPAVNVNNPETADCVTEEEINLRVVPPPTITAVLEVGEDQSGPADGDGTIVCLSEGPRQVVLHGIDMLEIDGALPDVTLDGTVATSMSIDGCEDLPTMGLTVRLCTRLTIEIPESLAAGTDPYQPAIEITNPGPAGCLDNTSDRPGLLTIAPSPDVVSVEPPIVCIEDGDREVVIHGTDFLELDGEPPAVLFDGTVAPTTTAAEDCMDLTVGGKVVRRCDALRVTIAQDSIPLGQPDVTATNPQPAGCSDTESGQLTIIEGPEITSADPALVCTDTGDRVVILQGTGFLTIDGALPTVTFDGVAVTVDSAAGCMPVTVAGLAVEQCDALNLTITQGTLVEGDTVVVVDNPMPAGCTVTSDTAVTVPPAVALIDSVPNNVCESSVGPGTMITFNGMGLLQIDGTDFTVSADGTPTAATVDMSTCVPLDVDGVTVNTCGAFTISLDTTGMVAGQGITIDIDNPDAPSASGLASTCDLSVTDAILVVAPPTVTGLTGEDDQGNPIDLDHICAEEPVTINITGTGFVPGTIVTLIDAGDPTTTFVADMVTINSDTDMSATFSMGVPEGQYQLEVRTGGDCFSAFATLLTVDPVPLVFFVDPPVVFNGIDLDVTIFTTGLVSANNTLDLVDAGGAVVATLPYTNPDPGRINRLLATVPAGLTPGTYEVQITTEFGCVGSLPGGLTITDQTTIIIAGIDPSFVSPTRATSVTITADVAGTPFEELPRAYLNPLTGGGTATALRAVVFVDGTNMTAVIPEGMASGDYQLVVVNPAGDVGVLGDAVTPGVVVTVNEPPEVVSVVPASLVENTSSDVTISGFNFDAAGTTVALDCGGTIINSSNVVTNVDGTDPANPSTSVATFDTSTATSGDVCLLILTNGDGAFFTYSALSVTGSSFNIRDWNDSATALNSPRRALALAAGRPTNSSRFIYAIGGDDGVAGDAAVQGAQIHDTVEAANVGVLGGVGAWNVLDYPLPGQRTSATAVKIDRFVYLTGGHDGTSATDTILRAQILDPLSTPEVIDLDANLDDASGLAGGLWYYRVSAVYPSTYASNPDGESLAGEVLSVQLPDLSADGRLIQLELTWSQDPDASGYRIYRSPVVDAPLTAVELIAEISGGATVTYTDLGGAPIAPTIGRTNPQPMIPGSLGAWHQPDDGGAALAALVTPREGHVSFAVPDFTTPDTWVLHTVGGRDDTGTYLASHEYVVVTIDPLTGAQTLGVPTTGAGTLGAPKAEMSAWLVTPGDSALVPAGEVWVYIGLGRTTGGATTSNTTDVAIGGGIGDLTNWRQSARSVNSATGYGYGAANGRLFIFGGWNPGGGLAYTASNPSGAVCAGSGAGCDAAAAGEPGVGNFNAGDGQLSTSRAYMGVAQESAFFFLVGGHDGATTLDSTEQNIQ